MAEVRFKGMAVDLGGTQFTVPPLALGKVKDLLPRIRQLRTVNGVPGEESIDTMLDVIQAAMARNYPDITKDQLLELIDLGNVKEIFQGIMGQSGLKPTEDSPGNSAAP